MGKNYVKGLVIGVIGVMMLTSFVGCDAKKEYLKNQDKEECTLVENDATKFKYDDKEYTILNETVDEDKCGSWVGFIQKYAAIDKDYNIVKKVDIETNAVSTAKEIAKDTKDASFYVPYMNVYKKDDNVYIDVDNAYHKTVLSKDVKDSDKKIAFTENKKKEENASNNVEVNKNDVKKINYKGKTYKITNEKVNEDKKGDFIGSISQTITYDKETGKRLSKDDLSKVDVDGDGVSKQKRESIEYGLLYAVKGDKNSIAVEVNNDLVYAK